MFTQDPAGVFAASNRATLAALQTIEASDAGLVEFDQPAFTLDLFDAVDLHELHEDDDSDYAGES